MKRELIYGLILLMMAGLIGWRLDRLGAKLTAVEAESAATKRELIHQGFQMTFMKRLLNGAMPSYEIPKLPPPKNPQIIVHCEGLSGEQCAKVLDYPMITTAKDRRKLSEKLLENKEQKN